MGFDCRFDLYRVKRGEAITLEQAQMVLGTATSQMVVDIVDALLRQDIPAGLNLIHQALDDGSGSGHITNYSAWKTCRRNL